MKLGGKVALVTGAGSGIGKATALLLAQEGAKVGVLDLDANETQEVQRQIEGDGGEALDLAADVSKQDQVQSAVEQLAQKWGRIDIVFANAGINGVWAPLDELKLSEWQDTLDTNLTGTFLTVKCALPYLKKRGGSVVITASVNGTRTFSNSGATAYSVSKAGQVAFAKMTALELAKDKVRVNVICPGWIETHIDESAVHRDLDKAKEPVEYPEGAVPLTDGKPGQPEQVARLVLFLASDAADHISGTEVWIDGAESLLQG